MRQKWPLTIDLLLESFNLFNKSDGFGILLLTEYDAGLCVKDVYEFLMRLHAIEDFGGNLMSAGDVLSGLFMLTLLAVLICQNCHHGGSVGSLEPNRAHQLRGNLLKFLLLEEGVEIADLDKLNLDLKLAILELFDQNLLIELLSLEDNLECLFALHDKAVLRDLQMCLHEVLGDSLRLWVRFL